MKHRLLIVDDDEEILTQMKWALGNDYEVLLAGDRVTAIDTFRKHRPAATLLDLGLPPSPHDTEEGMAALAGILSLDRHARVIVISGQGEQENAARAVGAGASDFHCKPIDMEELRVALQRAIYVAELEREYREMEATEGAAGFEGILGSSARMGQVFTAIRKVAASSAPVLILGESGTGKEMVANAIHRHSDARGGPFVAINCNAIPANLLESELFGHEKGSFTGAHASKEGLIEQAEGGSLFLDEIGDLPAALQVKLLRFLQERTFQRVGGRKEMKVETRVLSATNADLSEAIEAGTFREDLYFRLAVVEVRLPALRERGDDIPELAKDFLRRFAASHGKEGLTFTPAALRAIVRHTWPGNVRELQNKVLRAVIMCERKQVDVDDLELKGDPASAPLITLKEAREDVERQLVADALRRHNGKIAPTAVELGVSRPTLYELLKKLDISR